jgi:adenine deaminase
MGDYKMNQLWRNRQLREHVAVIDEELQPTLVLKNATYLNVYLKRWIQANIWIYQNRIVYVGENLPQKIENIEMVDCENQYIVPGYIEPHSHPFQLYNPHSFAQYAGQTGTTVLINDNLAYLYLLNKKKAFSLIEELKKLPVTMYWWARFDSQSFLQDEEEFVANMDVLSWLDHDAVLQGGELTSWTSLLRDDDRMLHWIQETKRLRKPVEGHLPGASLKTLTKMKLLGVDSDHEAISGEEVYRRLLLGYRVALRNSSIRPDLKDLIKQMKNYQIESYDNMMFTTDGSTPAFYKDGIIDQCIQIAIEEGIPHIEAYLMATYNVAKHFAIDHLVGSIGPGRIAHLNFLASKDNPHPVSVLAKGKWLKKDGEIMENSPKMNWSKYGLSKLDLDWELNENDFQFFIPVGLELANNVILKPFAIREANLEEQLEDLSDNAFVALLDRSGSWRISTLLRNFTKSLGGLVSSFSTTGDITIIGKRKEDIYLAFNRMKEIGGGIVLANEGKVIYELPLELAGLLSNERMEILIQQERQLSEIIKEHGYPYEDPIYTLLFLSAVHLPYIRITPKGIIDVKKKDVLFPAIMR